MLNALGIAPAEFGFRPRPIRSPARDWLLVAIEAANDAAEARNDAAINAAEARNDAAINAAGRP
jgi:hypothetical protein